MSKFSSSACFSLSVRMTRQASTRRGRSRQRSRAVWRGETEISRPVIGFQMAVVETPVGRSRWRKCAPEVSAPCENRRKGRWAPEAGCWSSAEPFIHSARPLPRARRGYGVKSPFFSSMKGGRFRKDGLETRQSGFCRMAVKKGGFPRLDRRNVPRIKICRIRFPERAKGWRRGMPPLPLSRFNRNRAYYTARPRG
jgi:hypothetical protein